MNLRGKYYSIHRECLASAPLPDEHRRLVFEAIQALQSQHRSVEYSVIEYDLKAGSCRFLNFDCAQPWPEAKSKLEYVRDKGKVRKTNFRPGTGPVLVDQGLLLPNWNPYSRAAQDKLKAAHSALHRQTAAAERPLAKSWKEPDPSQKVSWHPTEPDENVSRVCAVKCEGCYLSLGKSKKAERHLTAIKRYECSRPIKNALRDELIQKGTLFLDYGCGQGEDCERLTQRGVKVQGWDPVFRPLPLPKAADVVNLGYVINVVEEPQERISTLTKAFKLAQKLLIVTAYMDNGKATKHAKAVPFSDGVLTSRGTFQKLYRQKELRLFIESTLGQTAYSADFGVYYVFKDEALLQDYLARRDAEKETSSSGSTNKSTAKPSEEIAPELLAELAEATIRLGRLPLETEFEKLSEARRAAGSLSALREQVFGELDAEAYEASRKQKKTEFLISLASARLSTHGRPLLREMSKSERADVTDFFSNYKDACSQADELLFQLGNSEAISAACEGFGMGKLLPDALYIHVSLEAELPLLIKLLVGCARNYAEGELPSNVTVLKIKRDGSGVTFIESEDFFEEPHPAVLRITKAQFLKRKVSQRDFSTSANPNIYHRKEAFLSPEHPAYEKFAKLTSEEEEAELLGGNNIGRRNQWLELLESRGLAVRGHRLVSL